jgi:hypothetical protein
MTKSYGSTLRLNSHLNGKNHQPTFNDFVCDENHFKKINTNPLLFVKLNLIIYIYMYTITIKKINS